jgi:hypothetical protein
MATVAVALLLAAAGPSHARMLLDVADLHPVEPGTLPNDDGASRHSEGHTLSDITHPWGGRACTEHRSRHSFALPCDR